MTPIDRLKNAYARIADVSGTIVAGAMQDSEELRTHVTQACDKARATLAGMPQDGKLTPVEADTLFAGLEDIIGSCQVAVSQSEDRERETVSLLGRMGLAEVA
jgi:hypothetical protein